MLSPWAPWREAHLPWRQVHACRAVGCLCGVTIDTCTRAATAHLRGGSQQEPVNCYGSWPSPAAHTGLSSSSNSWLNVARLGARPAADAAALLAAQPVTVTMNSCGWVACQGMRPRRIHLVTVGAPQQAGAGAAGGDDAGGANSVKACTWRSDGKPMASAPASSGVYACVVVGQPRLQSCCPVLGAFSRLLVRPGDHPTAATDGRHGCACTSPCICIPLRMAFCWPTVIT